MVEPRHGLGGRVRAVLDDVRRDAAADGDRAQSGAAMRRGLPALAVNGTLIVIAALTLFPLVWMASVSLMTPGEASSYPPPLWPAHPTLANYRDLFFHGRLGRHFLNGLGI